MAFTEPEAEAIREALLDAGREYFSSFGLRRTRVEDLARKAGVAKGSFYRFFTSKEELCFKILEAEEEARDSVLSERIGSIGTPEDLAALLIESFDTFESSSVAMRILELGEMPLMLRKVPALRITDHQRHDRERMKRLVAGVDGLAALASGSPDVLAGLFRALFMISMHRREIGTDVFHAVRELLLTSVAKGLWRGEEGDDRG